MNIYSLRVELQQFECLYCYNTAVKVLGQKVRGEFHDKSWVCTWTNYVETGAEVWRRRPANYLGWSPCATCGKDRAIYADPAPYILIN